MRNSPFLAEHLVRNTKMEFGHEFRAWRPVVFFGDATKSIRPKRPSPWTFDSSSLGTCDIRTLLCSSTFIIGFSAVLIASYSHA